MFSEAQLKVARRNFAVLSKAAVPSAPMFTYFSTEAGAEEGEPVYAPISELAQAAPILERFQADYNRSNPAMSLVTFDEAVDHALRLSRIISQPGGHALLVGIGGSGARRVVETGGRSL